jgi:hypothetical protein
MGTARLLLPELILLAVATFMVLWAAFASAATPEAREKLRAKSVWVGAIGLAISAAVYFIGSRSGEGSVS